MPENVEIKATARDFQRQHLLAQQISGSSGETLFQKDIFFHVPKGRLKLRFLSEDHGELISYERSDLAGPRRSVYHVLQTKTPESLRTVLASVLRVRGTVAKKRTLYWIGQTRVHLDEVEGLGRFIELEVVLQPGQTNADGEDVAAKLMKRLEIAKEDLIAQAYIDLLENQG
jgi:predicted adenylyl cyclase CyaB